MLLSDGCFLSVLLRPDWGARSCPQVGSTGFLMRKVISCSHQGKDKYLLETRAQKTGLGQTRKGSSLGPGSPGPQLASHGASPNRG